LKKNTDKLDHIMLYRVHLTMKVCSTVYCNIHAYLSIKICLNSNTMSFFRFVNKRAIYRLGIISLAHAPVHTFKPGNKIIK
jgi:hypothetical protein